MHTQPTTSVSISGPQVAAVRLRLGAEVIARVIEAAGDDGRGLLSLAGAVVRARLPAGLVAGDRLRLVVSGRDGDKLVLRLLKEEHASVKDLPAGVIADLAESGDGEQLRAAVALAGGPIALPGGRVLTVEPDGGDKAAAEERPDEGAVRVVLHTPSLGALELHIGLHGSCLDVNVTAATGVAEAAASAAADLRASVQSATGLPATVEVVERRGAAPLVPFVPAVSGMERFA